MRVANELAQKGKLAQGGVVDATSITVSLPTELLRDVERIARERNLSLDTLMAETLTNLIEFEQEYAAAKADYLSILAQDIFAGNDGKPLGPRDDLYKRE
jgi:cytosine/adenosine deaminase-related metal-dependent hydrolase